MPNKMGGYNTAATPFRRLRAAINRRLIYLSPKVIDAALAAERLVGGPILTRRVNIGVYAAELGDKEHVAKFVAA